ncbi:MAG: hypothetical protein ABJK39_12745 [Hyphomicrobiales bacterium]
MLFLNTPIRRILAALTLSFSTLFSTSNMTHANKMLPLETYKQMLSASASNGWVAFRNYNGKQFVYLTHLQTLRCRIKEARVSFNSTALDNRVALLPCNPDNPFAIPSTPDSHKFLYVTFAPGTVATTTIQVTWEDDTQSEIVQFRPCNYVGDQTCAVKID